MPQAPRRLSIPDAVHTFSLDGYSGVSIKKNRASIVLNDNVALARTPSGLVVAANEVNITGDLRISGSILNEELRALQATVDHLQGNISVLQGTKYCDDCFDVTVEDFLVIETFNNDTDRTTLIVDPANTGGCPGELILAVDDEFNFGRGLHACYRNMTTAGARAFYYEATHDVGSIDIDLAYHQHYSADAFASASSSTVNSDYFVEGVTFATINSLGERHHVYTAAVGYSRGASYSSYNCPSRNCEYTDSTYCNGPKAPLWMGDAYSCNSGSPGAPDAAWYGTMEATFSAAVRMEAGDLLEVRVMADQATSNEDVGISKLTMTLSSEFAYPFDGGSGWVEMEPSTENKTVIGINPSVSGNCPGALDLVRGFEDTPTCTRTQTAGGAVGASFEVSHDVGTFSIDELEYTQYYSADAFAPADGTDIDDLYFMDGFTIAHVDSASSRHHLFSAAVGLTYDSDQPDYNCPVFPNCGYSDSDYCVGPAAPLWMGKNIYCNSGNSGSWESTWYAPMGPEDSIAVGTVIEAGEDIEVRLMADQASSNEDVGITHLKMTLRHDQTYPYDMGNGWVVFEEPEDGKVIVGIDPSVGGKCPGGFALVHGYNGVPTCSRALTAGGSVSASYSAPFDVGTVSVDVSYSQYYSADSFASAADTDIDDSYFMEGITIASVNDNSVRSHIFSASVGIAYDTAYTDYNCPPLNCGMDDSTYCVGPYAPAWMGLNFYCDSGNAGAWEAVWYPPMGPPSPVTVGTTIVAGDDIEVRCMADQATSNEDAGIVSLKLTLEVEQTYPYDMGNGWVVFEEPTDSTVVVGIDPRVGGRCPGGFALLHGYQGSPVCTRVSTAAGAVAATFDAPFDVGTVVIDLKYNQYYSADAFASADGASIDDSYFMEGLTIASIDDSSVRTHIFSAAVGIAYDTLYTDYGCPIYQCDYPDQSFCGGPAQPVWLGGNFYCNSKNAGTWEATWYAPMGPEDPVTVATTISEGDAIEVRAMADQASSNEDVGITSLKMTLKTKQTYPVDTGAGWVLFAAPETTTTVIGIDPRVGGKCPGAMVNDIGYRGAPICTRQLTAAGSVAATFELAHDATSVKLDLAYAQHYSADGFASASSATLDDDYFMEGVAIARLAADGTREHIFAAAVGIAYDTANTGYNCPSSNCGYNDTTYCVGPSAPSFVGTDYWCDSGNPGTWEQIWYKPMNTPTWTVAMDFAKGDTIEVRAMADQASSNEDVGIQRLKMTFS
eukprot:INCI583.1.p1 GENE.INCI583.1~~INCI583.1.p1  ORF type:complete len:1394 (+),score=246.06 INCI583.1:490-4182(+)